MGFDVAFSGLMIICLQGQQFCPKQTPSSAYPNTAWVLKGTDGSSSKNICGYNLDEKTTLELQLEADHWDLRDPQSKCVASNGTTKCRIDFSPACIGTDRMESFSLGKRLKNLPNQPMVDDRFVGWRVDRLTDSSYVSNRIHFSGGKVRGAAYWKVDHSGSGPTLDIDWLRTRDDASVGKLSPALIVNYPNSSKVIVKNCSTGDVVLELTNKTAGKAIVVANQTATPGVDIGAQAYDLLPFLLWYSRMASWDTADGECPSYSSGDASILKCRHPANPQRRCSGYPPAESVYWPPYLGWPIP